MRLHEIADALKTPQKQRGVIVGSLFKVPSVDGFSLKWKAKIRQEGKLVDVAAEDLVKALLEDGCFRKDEQGRDKGLLIIPNKRKRNENDPEYVVLAYPEAK